MKHFVTLLLAAGALTVSGNCYAQSGAVRSDSLARICTLSFDPALEVEVRDSMTNELLTPRAVVIVTDGVYSDTLTAGVLIPDAAGRELIPKTVAGAHERAGTYQIHVSVPGYRTWIRSRVKVNDGECHVQTRLIVARLQRAMTRSPR